MFYQCLKMTKCEIVQRLDDKLTNLLYFVEVGQIEINNINDDILLYLRMLLMNTIC